MRFMIFIFVGLVGCETCPDIPEVVEHSRVDTDDWGGVLYLEDPETPIEYGVMDAVGLTAIQWRAHVGAQERGLPNADGILNGCINTAFYVFQAETYDTFANCPNSLGCTLSPKDSDCFRKLKLFDNNFLIYVDASQGADEMNRTFIHEVLHTAHECMYGHGDDNHENSYFWVNYPDSIEAEIRAFREVEINEI